MLWFKSDWWTPRSFTDVKFLEKFTLGKTIKMCANIRLNNTDFDIPILPHGLRHHITTQQNTWALNSLRLNGHFLGEPGLAGVYWSTGWWRWWWQLDYWSYKSCKAPVKLSPQQTNIQFFYRLGALPVAQTVSKHWMKISHSMDLLTQSSPLPTLSLTINSSWLPWGTYEHSTRNRN